MNLVFTPPGLVLGHPEAMRGHPGLARVCPVLG